MTLLGRILIIDDEASLRQTFARVLRQAGCEVTVAADGHEGLRLLTAANYDLVYLDIHLPGMDGLQVLKQIQQSHPQLPTILFTAHASLQSALQAMRLGAIDYLIKPIDPESLIARTRVVLAERAVERRRRELQEQIEALQAELKKLDDLSGTPPQAESAPVHPVSGDRFFKRGPLILDLQARRVTLGEKVLALPPASFDYLLALTRHSPDIVDYQTLVAEAQGYQTDRQQAQELAKWHIHELREAMESDPKHPQYVLNVRGIGYRLVVD